MRNNLDLSIPLLADMHSVTQVPNTVVDFDLVVQKFFESGDIQDLVGGRLGGVDDVLCPVQQVVRKVDGGRLGGEIRNALWVLGTHLLGDFSLLAFWASASGFLHFARETLSLLLSSFGGGLVMNSKAVC